MIQYSRTVKAGLAEWKYQTGCQFYRTWTVWRREGSFWRTWYFCIFMKKARKSMLTNVVFGWKRIIAKNWSCIITAQHKKFTIIKANRTEIAHQCFIQQNIHTIVKKKQMNTKPKVVNEQLSILCFHWRKKNIVTMFFFSITVSCFQIRSAVTNSLNRQPWASFNHCQPWFQNWQDSPSLMFLPSVPGFSFFSFRQFPPHLINP